MSYHIYTTSGIVLKRTTFGEANILLYLLTKDLGLIIASAKSARLFSSKLRPSLQEGGLISVSCIKSKNGWKITNAVLISSFYFDYPEYTKTVVSQIFSLLLKMIVGEVSEEKIFDIVESGLRSLRDIKKEKIIFFETLIVLRILNELGYVDSDVFAKDFVKNNNDWGDDILDRVKEFKSRLVSIINKSLRESHL